MLLFAHLHLVSHSHFLSHFLLVQRLLLHFFCVVSQWYPFIAITLYLLVFHLFCSLLNLATRFNILFVVVVAVVMIHVMEMFVAFYIICYFYVNTFFVPLFFQPSSHSLAMVSSLLHLNYKPNWISQYENAFFGWIY